MSEMAKGSERSIANAPKVSREPHLANRNGRKLAIGIDPSGRAHYGKDNVQGDHVVAVLGEHVSDAYLAELREDGVSYLFAGQKGDDLPGAMEQLGSLFGVKKLLLEGGAKINGAFFKHEADRRVQHADLRGDRRRRRDTDDHGIRGAGRRSSGRRTVAAADSLRSARRRNGLAASRRRARARFSLLTPATARNRFESGCAHTEHRVERQHQNRSAPVLCCAVSSPFCET